jgi:hypothetical protein
VLEPQLTLLEVLGANPSVTVGLGDVSMSGS